MEADKGLLGRGRDALSLLGRGRGVHFLAGLLGSDVSVHFCRSLAVAVGVFLFAGGAGTGFAHLLAWPGFYLEDTATGRKMHKPKWLPHDVPRRYSRSFLAFLLYLVIVAASMKAYSEAAVASTVWLKVWPMA